MQVWVILFTTPVSFMLIDDTGRFSAKTAPIVFKPLALCSYNLRPSYKTITTRIRSVVPEI